MAKKKQHFEARLTVPKRERGQCDEIKVIGDGNLTYVWIGKDDECVANFGGKSLLLELVDALQKALRKD